MIEDEEFVRRELIDAAKNWLAIDGLWFLTIENRFGLEAAIDCDAEVWEQFSRIEANRIISRLKLPENGGLDTLETALQYRLFSLINSYQARRLDKNTLEWYMLTCRTQTARTRKDLPLFPCKKIGIIDYVTFATRIDPRIKTECISCPPDHPTERFCCGWKFSI